MTTQTPRIWLSPPHLSGEESSFIDRALQSNWIAPLGPNVDKLEDDIAAAMGTPHAVCLSSGTAAIHLALILLGVKPKDEVLVQSFTFAATANPALYLGARTIFVGSEEKTWNMSPALLEEAIIDRIRKTDTLPKAIIPVHLYGMPAMLRDLVAIADRYQIPLIEDAAESLGSSIEGRATGSVGDFGVLSFNGNKIITTSGGGALLTRNERFADKARFLASQARDPAPHYEHSTLGYNYRLSNISAAIGRAQIRALPHRIAARRAIFDRYQRELSKEPGISFLAEPTGYFSNRWLTTVLFDDAVWGIDARDRVRLALARFGIESRPLWKPLHLQPLFSHSPTYENGVSERLFAHGLCLPSGSSLTVTEQEEIIDRTIQALKSRAV